MILYNRIRSDVNELKLTFSIFQIYNLASEKTSLQIYWKISIVLIIEAIFNYRRYLDATDNGTILFEIVYKSRFMLSVIHSAVNSSGS